MNRFCVQSSANQHAADLSDDDALTQIKKGHDTMCVMLSSRRKNLQTVRTAWAREDVKVRTLLHCPLPALAQIQVYLRPRVLVPVIGLLFVPIC